MMIRGTLKLADKFFEPFPNCFSWLNEYAPVFSMRGEQVEILQRPDEFYGALMDGCRSAERRIALASLYIGTGSMERQLIEQIQKRLSDGNVVVSIVLDANRGSRGQVNSRKILLPLLENKNCQVSLFHTPSLRGPLKALLPSRYNELVGLHHAKLYLFDDSVLISGANLSKDYFTNRQDRYIMLRDCPELADFYWGLLERVSSVSLALDKTDCLSPRSHHPYKTSVSKFVTAARNSIWGFYQSEMSKPRQQRDGDDTWVYPLLELPPLNIHQDSEATQRLLQTALPDSVLTLSTGYFNLTDVYAHSIVSDSAASYDLVMAHPSANGFQKAGGLASGIPEAYTGLALNFLKQVTKTGQSNRIRMLEYSRTGWTFHAKGLWYTLPGELHPSLTSIGSSNFGSRSVERDLETQIIMTTSNPMLRSKLHDEVTFLKSFTTEFNSQIGSKPERKPALWIKTAMKLFKTFF